VPDVPRDEVHEARRQDLNRVTVLCLPPLMLLILYGWHVHGLPGAAGGALACLVFHPILGELNRRRLKLEAANTELGHAGQALRDANRALEEKARALEAKQDELRAFVYTVTHDLKNPLAAILLLGDLIRERDGELLTAEGRDDLDRLVHLAGATEDMIRDLLNLFRITSSQEEVAEVDLNGLVAHAVQTLRPQILAKRVELEVSALPPVLGQNRKLGAALTNLLSNAVKYVPAGRGRVTVSGDVLNGKVRLCVRDNGIGIADAYQRNIFELFGRVPASEQVVDGRSVEGTGVGLAIVKRSVEACGGSVWVESAVGEGSRFYVELAAARERRG
jgi:signal transduction histidine kinase